MLLPPTTGSAASPPILGTSARSSPSTCLDWGPCRGCEASTCSATSGPIRSRSRASARACVESTFRPPRWSRLGAWRRWRAPTSTFARPTCTSPAKCSVGVCSISSSRASARSAGCPTYVAGQRWSRRSCVLAGASSCARATRCFSLAEVGHDGRLVVEDAYFERSDPTVIEQSGTYVETGAAFSRNLTHQWNHGLGEVITALLDQGMLITALVEHDSVPWEALPGHMERLALGEWRLRDRPFRLPHTYTLQAVKA